jgi:hypothetical protein
LSVAYQFWAKYCNQDKSLVSCWSLIIAAVMPAIATDTLVRYRLTPLVKGVRLEIWELPAKRKRAQAPFLFRVNYYFDSLPKAEAALEQYIHNNGLRPASDTQEKDEECLSRRIISISDTYY